MSMLKQVQQLESDMFDAIELLHIALQYKQREDFNMALALIEEMNDEYEQITHKPYITPLEMIKFHEKKWEL